MRPRLNTTTIKPLTMNYKYESEITASKAVANLTNLKNNLLKKLAGQDEAIDTIIPYINQFQIGISPEDRPAGIFLLLGPTGTGKTLTVESLAECIHGSKKNVLTINCGEYQFDHDVAKLIGAPPGYLGHRETQPAFNQHKLNSVASENSCMSIVLFDEIEKSAPSMMKILLGIMDKGIMKLGDNSSVNFERCFIFMTSNLGAKDLYKSINEGFGFNMKTEAQIQEDGTNICRNAMRKHFSPEFINRIDETIIYQYLSHENMKQILNMELSKLENFLIRRLGPDNAPSGIRLSKNAFDFILEKGFNKEYGARELKRVIQKYITHQLPYLINKNNEIYLELENNKLVKVEHA